MKFKFAAMNTNKNRMTTRLLLTLAVPAVLMAPGCKAYDEISTNLACRDNIRDVLKDPKSAEFDNVSYKTWISTGKTHSVTWVTRATNSFGGYKSQPMTCHYDETGRFKYVSQE